MLHSKGIQKKNCHIFGNLLLNLISWWIYLKGFNTYLDIYNFVFYLDIEDFVTGFQCFAYLWASTAAFVLCLEPHISQQWVKPDTWNPSTCLFMLCFFFIVKLQTWQCHNVSPASSFMLVIIPDISSSSIEHSVKVIILIKIYSKILNYSLSASVCENITLFPKLNSSNITFHIMDQGELTSFLW